jgi:hypothetical protein
MKDINDVLHKIIGDYAKAMSQFDGDPCAECGDPLDHTQSNYFPVWSDDHDNLVCMMCYDKGGSE